MAPDKTLDLQNDQKGAREIISNLTVLEDQMKNLLIEEVIFVKNLKTKLMICHSHSNRLCAALYFCKFDWIPYLVQHEIKLLKSLLEELGFWYTILLRSVSFGPSDQEKSLNSGQDIATGNQGRTRPLMSKRLAMCGLFSILGNSFKAKLQSQGNSLKRTKHFPRFFTVPLGEGF